MNQNKFDRVPRYNELLTPTFLVLKKLGGSGTNDEIHQQIVKLLKLSSKIVEEPHLGSTTMSELMYQLAWARTYLKKYGVINNSTRAVWSITPEYIEKESIDDKEIVSFVRQNTAKKHKNNDKNELPTPDDEKDDMLQESDHDSLEITPWKKRLEEILLSMNPYGFERLTQRILRECGFTQVVVTQKSGDGGIDGYGKLKINGIFSFNVAFQCKRYQSLVGAPAVRDFRGSLTKNVEKGVLITTGRFSESAKREASHPGKQQIDLIDGEELIQKIADFRIGVNEVTTYEIDEEFFRKI